MIRDIVLGLILSALGLYVCLVAKEFPSLGELQFGAGLFPIIIGTGLIGGGLLLAALSLRKVLIVQTQTQGAPAGWGRPSWSSITPVIPCLLVLGYIYLSESLGTALYMMIAMFLLFCLRGVRLLPALAVSVTTALLISYLFTRVLSVPLPTNELLGL